MDGVFQNSQYEDSKVSRSILKQEIASFGVPYTIHLDQGVEYTNTYSLGSHLIFRPL